MNSGGDKPLSFDVGSTIQNPMINCQEALSQLKSCYPKVYIKEKFGSIDVSSEMEMTPRIL